MQTANPTILARWPRRAVNAAVPLAWTTNALLLGAAAAWFYVEGRSQSEFHSLLRAAGWPGAASVADGDAASCGAAIVTCATAAVVSLGVAFLGLLVGAPRFRTLRVWGLFTALAAVWLTLLATWPDVHWSGQQRRVARALPALESVALSLIVAWPQNDGDIDALGPFLAYPKGSPRTLLIMGDAALCDSPLRMASVERTPGRAIRFELSGQEQGAWVEWRSGEDTPSDFVSGLRTPYLVERSERLAPHWFLVRYTVDSTPDTPIKNRT